MKIYIQTNKWCSSFLLGFEVTISSFKFWHLLNATKISAVIFFSLSFSTDTGVSDLVSYHLLVF